MHDLMADLTSWFPGSILAPSTPAIALLVSLAALVVATRSYARKSGTQVRGSYGTCSSVNCEDMYISNVVLENIKDRAVSIFGIYLQVGHNYYITIDEFDNEPVILRPYETKKFEYGPIEIYAVSSTRVDINEMLKDQKVRKRIVLSTTDGRYNVPARIKPWNPVSSMFSNHLTGVLRPIRNMYNGEAVGGNIRYIVHFTHSNGKEEVVHLRPEDHRFDRFRNFRLTKESLDSKEALELLLDGMKKDGKITSMFKVHDLAPWRDKELEFYSKRDVHVAEPINWVMYYVVGRLLTLRKDRRRRASNRRRREQHAIQLQQKPTGMRSGVQQPEGQLTSDQESSTATSAPQS